MNNFNENNGIMKYGAIPSQPTNAAIVYINLPELFEVYADSMKMAFELGRQYRIDEEGLEENKRKLLKPGDDVE